MKPLFVAGLAAMTVSATPIDAADGGGSCGGNLIEYVPFNVGGQKIGQLQLYYNPSNGNNCAIMYHGGPTWGVPKDTGVLLARSRTRANFQQAAYQRSTYSYQAGPIRTDGAGWCVYAGGGISYGGTHHTLYTGQHCR